MAIEFSRKAAISLHPIGREQSAVAVIDDAVEDPQALINQASLAAYSAGGPYYPGVRADAGEAYRAALARAALPLIRSVFGAESPQWRIECFFSLVTLAPENLALIQRLPHYDGVDADRFAVVHYLCDPKHGGTSFYRHVDTGHEIITAARFESYRASLAAGVAREGEPPLRYVDDGAPLFERIAHFECRFNRLLIYRGAALHCSTHGAGANFSADPKDGRLTVTAFLTRA